MGSTINWLLDGTGLRMLDKKYSPGDRETMSVRDRSPQEFDTIDERIAAINFQRCLHGDLGDKQSVPADFIRKNAQASGAAAVRAGAAPCPAPARGSGRRRARAAA